jgi:signal recognition particle receptor subunit beta
MYYGEKVYQIPIIVCLNKQDLTGIISDNMLMSNFGLERFSNYKIVHTIAKEGKGVVGAFYNMLEFLFPSIPIAQ